MDQRATVAVIGAGFSGLLTALRLLLAPDGPKVILIERGARFGLGAAYSTGSPHHLLNVRATNMSAFVEQPSHFIDWLRAADGTEAASAPDQVFVTRERYGRYLQALLRKATGAGRGEPRLTLEHDEVLTLAPMGERWRLGLGVGRAVEADVVVLALGNLPPPAPAPIDEALAASGRYAADPWAWDPARSPPEGSVLLLGSGLTAVDMALSIHEHAPGTRIVSLSRHGLTPRRHAETSGAVRFEAPPRGSPARVLATVRGSAGDDWRVAIDALRPHVQGLWRGWTLAERRRFLRHLRPWWDVHRHRLAPMVGESMEAFRRQGIYEVIPGRLRGLTLAGGGVEAAWSARGGGPLAKRTFDIVVNCSGPRGEVAGSGDPLIGDLLARGLIRPDACDLGLDVDARSRVIGADARPRDTLFAVGPITRGQFYEITSVPDIRGQAADCAGAIVNTLALRQRTPTSGAGADARGKVLGELVAFVSQSLDELDVELGSLKYTRRVRNAWELRGRRAALGEIALWLDEHRDPSAPMANDPAPAEPIRPAGAKRVANQNGG